MKLGHGPILSKRISKKKVEELAIQKYRICGKGILFFMTKCVNLTDISTITQKCITSLSQIGTTWQSSTYIVTPEVQNKRHRRKNCN